MYKNFFGFQYMPFSQIAYSDCDLVFTSQNYAMVLPTLVSSLDRNVALTLVLGEKGVGKTTFINYVHDHLQQDSNIRLINARLESSQDFFQQIITSFEQDADSFEAHRKLMQLGFSNTHLVEQDKRATILIIDDADSMTTDALKAIELLLRLNTENNLVLQLILVGAPKLRQLLNDFGLPSLMQNTIAQCLLKPLSQEDTQEYINHKVHLAGVQNKTLFSEQACSTIYEYSKGIPAIINRVCDKALLRGSELQKHEIRSELIDEVINGHTGISIKKTPWFFSSIFILAVLGVILALLFLPGLFISVSKDSQIEWSNNLQNIPVKDLSSVQMNDPEKKYPQKDSIKGQTKKTVASKLTQRHKMPEKAMIATLHTIAELQFSNSQFIAPEKDNAYQTYQEILAAAPDDKRAKEGVQSIGKYYLDQAKKQYIKGSLEKSLLSVSKGLKVYPDSKGLIQLEMQITAELKQSKKHNKINALLKQAKQQFESLRLTKPENDNAYKTYQEIDALDNNNREAKQGILNILAQLESAVLRSLNKESYEEALENAKKIALLSSKGLDDPFHKEAVIAASETKNIIDRHIKTLLGQAKKQLIMRQFTSPAGSNAFESYNKALLLDPNSKEASKGLGMLKKQYYESIKAAISAEKIDKAIDSANEGLKVFPNDSELLSLRYSAILQRQVAIEKANDSADEKNTEDNGQELKNFGTF